MISVTNEAILAALTQHRTVSAAAAALGISTRAMYDRMQKTDFRVMYEEVQSDLMRKTAATLQDRVNDAVETIADIMTNEDATPSVRLQAAQSILDLAAKFTTRLSGQEKELRSLRFESQFGLEI